MVQQPLPRAEKMQRSEQSAIQRTISFQASSARVSTTLESTPDLFTMGKFTSATNATEEHALLD